MVPERTSVIVFKPAAKSRLNVKFKLRGTWVKRSTPYKPGQETEAKMYGLKLIQREAEASNPTFKEWAEKWLLKREKSIRDADNDRSRLEHHVYPVIGDMKLVEVQPAHVVDIVDRLKAAELAPRTIRNVYSVVKALFRDARIDGIDHADPCILTKRQLGKVRDADLGWRQHAVLSKAELEYLLSSPTVPLDRRVLYGLMAVGMLRDGEACGLLWGDVLKPKGALVRIVVRRSYDVDTTKTETERWVPVHPFLHALLTEWKAEWPKMMERPYTKNDLVVPCPKPTNRGPRKPLGSMRDKNFIWKRWAADLQKLGLRHRRAHDMRRTGITLYKMDGASPELLNWASHAPPKKVNDLYTSVEWQALCREISKLTLEQRLKLDDVAPEFEQFRRVKGTRVPPEKQKSPAVAGTTGDQAQTISSIGNYRGNKWRRRESNPGPKDFQRKALRA